MNNLDEDIKILKEKLKILNDTKLKKTDQLERELQAIENVLLELGNLKWKNEIYVKSIKSHKNTIEKQDKMIDLMAKEFLILDSFVGDYDNYTVDKLKEYFRKKVEND